jgi:serine/threonine protein kinase
MSELPPRYEPLRRLGAGGGGEVWSVRDRVTGGVLALKLLARDAGEAEIGALVREAVALSGLEGLGVPRVAAFGALADGRRYMLRELVEGRSLDEMLRAPSDASAAEGGGTFSLLLESIASACDKLTVVHRAGLLHGDIKPANIIVDGAGRGTWVDLGLSAPWRDGGAAAKGITPRYAAPELLAGEALTVRAEVYSLGATLVEAIDRRGGELGEAERAAVKAVAARAVERLASARWPSADELASALRRAAKLPAADGSPGAGAAGAHDEPPWPVLGLEATARALLDRVRAMPAGGAILLDGPRGSGRSTLARRLAWSLGVAGSAVAAIDASRGGLPIDEVIDLELAPA